MATRDSSGGADALPPATSLPATVHAARQARTRSLSRVTLAGVGLRLGIVAAELVAFSIWRADVLLVDAVASLADIAASLVLLMFIHLAARPPDANHPFGHGRYEPLAGMQMGLMVALLGGLLLGRQVWAMGDAAPDLALPTLAFTLPLVAAVVLEAIARWVRRVAIDSGSSALLAEAAHYRVDAATSLATAITLAVAAMAVDVAVTVDAIGALLLAALMIGLGFHAAWENARELLATAPNEAAFNRVRAAAVGVHGVRDIDKLHLQRTGPDVHVDIDVEVDPTMTVAAAHDIARRVRRAIQKDWPAVIEVVVHVEPFYADGPAPSEGGVS